MFKKFSEWLWPQFDEKKTKMLLGSAVTRLRLHQKKKRELVKKERAAVAELLGAREFEVARAKAASCIRDELLSEAYSILETLCETARQRLQLIAMYKDRCAPELEESFHSVVFAATRTEIPEFRALTDQLMLLYGEEWGRLANTDAHGVANQRVVRKLTIFANDTLVKQYLQDIMGADYDPEEAFAPTALLGDGDDDAAGGELPQNAAQMERELAARKAQRAVAADAPTEAMFEPVADSDDDEHKSGGGGGGGGGGGQRAQSPAVPHVPSSPTLPDDLRDDDPFPEPPGDLRASTPDAHTLHTPPPAYDAATAHVGVGGAAAQGGGGAPSMVDRLPAHVQMSISPSANNDMIAQETAAETSEDDADDLLARFNALKPKRATVVVSPPPASAKSALDNDDTPGETAVSGRSDQNEDDEDDEDDDTATLNLLKSFPSVDLKNSVTDSDTTADKAQADEETAGDDDDDDEDGEEGEGKLTSSTLEGLMPPIPGGDDDDDNDGDGLNLPSTPQTQLSRGIKPGSKEEKELDSLEDLEARFAALKASMRR